MLKIAIVGCGQIGSRHLQSLAQLEEGATINLIDPSSESIAVAKSRFEDALPGNVKDLFNLCESNIDELESHIDVAIISCGAKDRAYLTREILEHTTPRYIIFEKFLFQIEADYDEIGTLLASRNVKGWVNQWISSAYAFRRIVNWLKNEGPISVKINGDDWGMGCNSVHFIDYFDYLNGRQALSVKSCELDNEMLPSKREGYFEFAGKVKIQSDNGAILDMVSKNAESDGLINITIKAGTKTVKAILSRNGLSCDYVDESNSTHEEYMTPMQSNVTGKLIQRLMLTGECDLPDYDRSAFHHKLIINCFNSHIRNKCGWTDIACPIT